MILQAVLSKTVKNYWGKFNQSWQKFGSWVYSVLNFLSIHITREVNKENYFKPQKLLPTERAADKHCLRI